MPSLKRSEESEIAVLFETLLHLAGLEGRFTVRVEDFDHGTSNQTQTVRFAVIPCSHNAANWLLGVKWQCSGNDSARKGVVLSSEHEARDLQVLLCKTFPTQVFDMRRELKACEDHSADSIFDDPKKFRRAAKAICQHAAQTQEVEITRDALVALLEPIFPKVNFGPGSWVTRLFEERRYLAAQDTKAARGMRRFFVDETLFEACALVHPYLQDKPEHESECAPDDDPPEQVLAPAPPSLVSGGLSSFLAELRELKKKAAAAEQLKEEIALLEKEHKEQQENLALARKKFHLEEQRAMDAIRKMAERIRQRKEQRRGCADASDALKELQELRSLL